MIAGELMYYGAYQIMAATAALFVAVFGLFVLTPILIVITSYSIHYTKLYELTALVGSREVLEAGMREPAQAA